ncbi:response regulator transcription factor [Sphingobacterium deserti]|uniref:Two component LuxR family transcriptional regulator n=1 Tax=Sphingobacterium deserti TaxID=1229276 RepID=A0A0B8T134_9SPHI|nr:response regulator transcription factor [Sphingobacterium deserti]KGE14296.1 two component LuxR family transcriptional regulator [Sphingobacterium deserti]
MALIDSRPAYRQRLSDHFQKSAAFDPITSVSSVRDFKNILGRNKYDVVLCGLKPAQEAVQILLNELQSRSIATKIVLLAPLDQKKSIFQGLCFGATAFMPEQLPLPIMEQKLSFHMQDNYWLNPELARLMLRYFSGRGLQAPEALHILSDTEINLLEMVSEGACQRRVAEEQKAESRHIKTLVRGIFQKLHSTHRQKIN